ncbi:MAG: prepilin-type N-terminal cleavage/methylation domain-containing protein [Deltaproteobacteria bacterium]|nr:prepilin-type N-terminal cleavage/methylation domain-containing protein [Deltaproteobacteria bacterium]
MRKGFTLLEVLIAVFVLSIMSFLIWQITNNTYRGTEKAGKYDEVYQYARVAIKRLNDDLSMAFLAGPNLKGKQQDGTVTFETTFVGVNEGDADKMNFTSLSSVRLVADERKSDQIEAGYFISPCPEAEERINCLMRREAAVIDTKSDEGGESFPIAKGVKRFNVEYYDSNKQEWLDSWNSKDPALADRLPRAARITLTFYDPKNEDEELTFVTSVMLPLASGAVDF